MNRAADLDDPVALFKALLAADFCAFLRKVFPWINGGADIAWNWHLEAIAEALAQVASGKCCRLLVTMPPRNLKSIAISVAWVAWMLGRDPTLNFVCVSYSNELSGKLARDCRSVMQSRWFREVFPQAILSDKRLAVHDFETTAGGGRLATSITGTLTGRGGDIIIIDDPIKPDEADSETTRNAVNDWYTSTLASRLNDKGSGAIIVVMQRLHEDDLAGHLLQANDWSHLDLPAIAIEEARIPLSRGRKHERSAGDVLHPAREPRSVLDDLRRSMGSVRFEAQYQQNPVPAFGNMIKREWLAYYKAPLAGDFPGLVVQSWDTASKDGIHNDWSACITARVHRDTVHVVDVYRKRVPFPELLKAVAMLGERHRPNTLLIEDAASGQQLLQSLRERRPSWVPRPIACRPEKDKVTRVAAISAQIEAGRLVLPHDAFWLATFTHELLGFPNGRHDDQVDALAQLISWAARANQHQVPLVPPIIFENGACIFDGPSMVQ